MLSDVVEYENLGANDLIEFSKGSDKYAILAGVSSSSSFLVGESSHGSIRHFRTGA